KLRKQEGEMTIFQNKVKLEVDVMHSLCNEINKLKSIQSNQCIENNKWNDKFQLTNENYRFFRINELSLQEQFTLRQDLENVISCMADEDYALVYYLSGTQTEIEIYIGIVCVHDKDVFDQAKLLQSQLLGNISGIVLD